MSHCLVLDIGKTNVKLHVLNSKRQSVFSESRANKVLLEGDYPHTDVEGIWIWMISVIGRLTDKLHISRMSITTHGATAALINRNTVDGSSGLVLPILDYESNKVDQSELEYAKVKPAFSETYSPSLPAGLNLAKQLFWLQKTFPDKFSEATDILMYPQYWAWRLTGQRTSEITSLGCHTDLWSVKENTFSSLVTHMQWQTLFPEIQPAWTNLGSVNPQVAKQTGLPDDCQVFAGIHDSNASFLRYRLHNQTQPFTVISTGTWTILMSSGVPLDKLDSRQDMLANMDVMATPIACARFMGGREYEAICAQLGGAFGDPVDPIQIQHLIDKKYMALPDFSDGSGPFGGRKAEFIGKISANQGTAIATLYCAMMIDYQLDRLAAQNSIYIEGAFLQNPLMCSMLAQLRPQQDVWLSADATGTVQGCAYLTDWQSVPSAIELKPAVPTKFSGLGDYKKHWLTSVLQ